MGFGRGNLVRRQRLSGVRARYLGAFATVQVWGMRGLHTPNTSNPSFWIGPRRWQRERNALSRPAALLAGSRPARAGCARGASAQRVFGAGDEDAGAAGLAPDALVARARRTVIVVAREE